MTGVTAAYAKLASVCMKDLCPSEPLLTFCVSVKVDISICSPISLEGDRLRSHPQDHVH